MALLRLPGIGVSAPSGLQEFTRSDQAAGCPFLVEAPAALLSWRTSAPCTQKITSSAMLVAWSATRSRLRLIISAWNACGAR